MISIITITFNNFKELKNTLESIPQREFIESVIINGGNDPGTLEYLRKYKGIVINEKDSGIADAFNKGIRNSTGEFVMFLNSGDILHDQNYPGIAQKIMNENRDISFVHSNIYFHDSIGGEIFMRPQMRSVGRGQPYFHPTMVMRKNIFDQVGYFNTSYKMGMDFDLIVRMTKKGLKGKYLDVKPVVKMEGTGISAVREKDAIKECYRSLKENNYLTCRNRFGFLKRKLFYSGRMVLLFLGMKNILGSLKRIKHSE